ncbi:MAG: hypothetical protein ABI778_12900, partial [Ignavibacteriota bacterium]
YSTGRLATKSGVSDPALGSKSKTFDSSLVVPANGQTVSLKCSLATFNDVTFSFVPESGGIYEAFLVGRRGRSDGLYGPRFMVVKVN